MKRIINESRIVFVVVLILASVGNFEGYTSVQLMNQNNINIEIDQRELLFQTNVDL